MERWAAGVSRVVSSVTELAEQINRQIPNVKSGTLKFFGVWFGRPYDNIHTITYAEAINNRLCITFSEDEKLTVWDPAECEINRTVFTIGKASRVLWEWYSYGKAKEPENLCRQDYQVVEREIKVVTNYQPYKLSKPDLSELAIEICGIEASGYTQQGHKFNFSTREKNKFVALRSIVSQVLKVFGRLRSK